MPNTNFQQYRVFVRNDLVGKKIKSCRKSSKRSLKFKKKLGLDPNLVTCDEQVIIRSLKVAYEGEIILIHIVLRIKELMLIFLNTNLEYKVMNITMKA